MNTPTFSAAQILLRAVLLVSLAGCATAPLTFDKSGVGATDRERDRTACLHSALTTESGAVLAPYGLDRDAFIHCMEARGYTVVSK